MADEAVSPVIESFVTALAAITPATLTPATDVAPNCGHQVVIAEKLNPRLMPVVSLFHRLHTDFNQKNEAYETWRLEHEEANRAEGRPPSEAELVEANRMLRDTEVAYLYFLAYLGICDAELRLEYPQIPSGGKLHVNPDWSLVYHPDLAPVLMYAVAASEEATSAAH
jgi:hypothetical protein